jgi:hypothetical protein
MNKIKILVGNRLDKNPLSLEIEFLEKPYDSNWFLTLYQGTTRFCTVILPPHVGQKIKESMDYAGE